MIRVSHQYHYITADPKLKHRWAILMYKAACANALGEVTTYNNLCQIVRNEFAQWKGQAEQQCEQKTHTNWLGGGETYMVTETDPTDGGQRFRNILQGASRSEILQSLSEMERDGWTALYSPI